MCAVFLNEKKHLTVTHKLHLNTLPSPNLPSSPLFALLVFSVDSAPNIQLVHILSLTLFLLQAKHPQEYPKDPALVHSSLLYIYQRDISKLTLHSSSTLIFCANHILLLHPICSTSTLTQCSLIFHKYHPGYLPAF